MLANKIQMELESQHEHLLRSLEDLRVNFHKNDAFRQPFSRMIYVKLLLHFKYEEDQMRQLNYPSLSLHRQEHERLITLIDDLLKTMPTKDDLISAFEEVIADHIATFDNELFNWINNEHI